MNNRLVSESFTLPADKKAALTDLCAGTQIELHNNADGSVFFIGSITSRLSPKYSDEFQALLPKGGVLCYEISYTGTRYRSLELRTIPHFASITMNDDYINSILGMNRRLVAMLKKVPNNKTGKFFVTASINIEDEKVSAFKKLCKERGITCEKSHIGFSDCLRLSGEVTRKFNPFKAKFILEYTNQFCREWVFYVLKLKKGKLLGIDICEFNPRAESGWGTPEYATVEKTIMENGNLTSFLRMNAVLDAKLKEYFSSQASYPVK